MLMDGITGPPRAYSSHNRLFDGYVIEIKSAHALGITKTRVNMMNSGTAKDGTPIMVMTTSRLAA